MTLYTLLKRSTLYYVRDTFEVSFIDAAAQVLRFLQAQETDDDPPDERIANILLESWSIDATVGKLEAFVSVQTLDIETPTIVVPLSIPIGRLSV